MARNSAWRKNNRREIKNTLERYLAIMAIIALGIGFFSGLKITQRAMVENLDTYVSEHQMYDFRLLSSLGLTKEDVRYFSDQGGMEVEGAISMDFIADMGTENGVVLKAHSITHKINHLNLQYGRMPNTGDECVLDSRFFSEDVVGSKIRIASDNDYDTLDAFSYEEYRVVGIADSVNYLNYDRGTTSLAGGSVYAFVYIPEDGFSMDYYTEIFIGLKNGYNQVYSREYKDLISQKEGPIKEALESRGQIRYQEVVDQARQEVDNAQWEYDNAFEEYLEEKADAERELSKALEELEEAQQEIIDQEKNLEDAEEKIAEAEREYQNFALDYEKGFGEYEREKEAALAELEIHQEELHQGHNSVVLAMEQIEETGVINQHRQLTEKILSLKVALSQIESPDSEEYEVIQGQLSQAEAAVAEIEATGIILQYKELEQNLAEIEAGQKQLDEKREEAYLSFAAAKEQLEEAKSRLDSAKAEIDNSKQEILDGWNALEEGKIKYQEGLMEYEDGKKEAEEAFAEAEEELANAQKEIRNAWGEVEDISEAKVYVLNRSHNGGYASFENDSSIIEGIAKVLPIFFFLVAALVCSTTMTRMVDEQRTQIGTLKALGYSDGAIIRKYVFYSGSAAILGWGIGFLMGTKFFPIAIWKAYSIMYGFSPIEYVFDATLAAFSLAISLLCSVGVTYTSCKAELLQMPAQLIRPKAPKPGKRVLLEYVPVIWNRIGFLRKVSIRNILRYKRRFFMTVLGIAGCTSLVLGALGIRDSIRNVANDQFDTIMIYDYSISFTEGQSEEQRKQFTETFSEILSECVFVSNVDMEVVHKEGIKKVSVISTDDPSITEVIGLYLNNRVVSYPTFGKVVINDKLAKEFGLQEGDTITVRNSQLYTIEVEIGGIFENYIGDYLFMTAETYEALFKEEVQYKNAYAITEKEDLYMVSASILNEESVAIVEVINDMRTMVDNMMQSMNSIIWLVIVCAGALGFVVIYNLNNINITERSREIATIKVLGFYDGETKSYVFRETIILTLIGSIFGLGFGRLLHRFIMEQINVDAISFKRQIFGISYFIAVLVTFMITFFVNLILKKKIERINMTESLKSVE